MSHNAEIISVGTELLLGNITNTDARDIAQMLSELGINVYYQTVVGDNDARLREAVNIAKGRADILITTGGLGPTYDDMTKQTLAAAFGKELVFHEEEAERIRSYFASRLHARKMTDNNLQQAYLPEGCTVFVNDWGTAPGCAFYAEGVHVLMMPGPPRECVPMFRYRAMPYLAALSEGEIHSHNIHIFGMGESAVEAQLREMMLAMSNPTLAPYAKDGEVMLRLTAKAADAAEADALMAPALARVREILGDVIYGVDTGTLENTVLEHLKAQGKTLAVAESCTGGLLAKRLTDVPGSSAAFLGGVVTYANSAKTELLGVDAALIAREGAVCEGVARQMAEGVRQRLGADLGVGITGIAGPASDNTEKPVGMVFIALSAADRTVCRALQLGGDRDRIRNSSAHNALDMLRRMLTGLPVA